MGFNSVVKISELQCVVETPSGKSLYTAYDNVCRYWEIGAEGVGACYCKRIRQDLRCCIWQRKL